MSIQTLPWDWSFEPTVMLGVAIAALLYWRGTVYALKAGLVRWVSWWRYAAFAGGLLMIVVALESPLDEWSDTYLSMHMVQHMLLIFGAAPLLLFGAPLMPIWRALPLGARRSSLRWLMQHPRPRRLSLALGRFISSPGWIWVLFVGVFIAWHVPFFYDLALSNQNVHDLEHLLFLVTGLLFWAQAIPSAPLKPRLGYGAQALYTLSAGFTIQVVSLAMTFSGTPLYNHYVTVERPAGAISVMVDQTSAGALMNLVAMIVFGGVFMLLLWFWLDDSEKRDKEAEERFRNVPRHRAVI